MSEQDTAARPAGEPRTAEDCHADGGEWRRWLVEGIADRRLQEAISVWLDSEGYDVQPLEPTGDGCLGILAAGPCAEALGGEVWQAMRRAHPGLTLRPLADREDVA